MADYVATIHVPAWQTVWPADEVPHLTANALYRFQPEPDPMVTKGELRHFTSADLHSRTAGRSLSASELSEFVHKCQTARLPVISDGLLYSQWGAYLEAFNHDAESRGWWVGLIPPHDPNRTERLSFVIAADEHRKLLATAVETGEIQARMAGTMVPAMPGIVNLQHLVLTREALEAFAARLAIKVADMPHFVTSARPLELPAALLALSDDARVSYEENVAGWRGSGITNAADYRESIRNTMARQAEGHFTLNEAAQVLADSRPGLDPIQTVKRLRAAHSKGELRIHQHGSRFPLEVGETVRDFLDTVEVTELDAWLRASVGYGFPRAEGASLPAPTVRASVTQEPAPDRGRRVKRSALIADNVRRWPTIERDLKDAATNGLSEAAKDGAAVGWWWEGSAVDWARARAKVQDVAPGLAGMTGTIHRMRG